jgi:hypothetical protein
MKRVSALACSIAMVAGAGCAGTFGSSGPIGRSARISDSSRVTATSIVPDDPANRRVVEHLALAEEIYGKTLDALRARRNSLRERRRALTMGSYATFAATTHVIGAAAINRSTDETSMSPSGLRMTGYGALGGLGLGTTLEVVNLMQEDPSNVEAKIRYLQASYDNMIDRLRVLFEDQGEATPGTTDPAATGKAAARSANAQASPIIEAFINDALQINIKG